MSHRDSYASSNPVSTRPGATWPHNGTNDCSGQDFGYECSEGTKAAWTIQGDTDSFGCEYFYLCDCCKKKFDNAEEEERIENIEREGYCEWHRGTGKDIKLTRDIDGEGYSGPLYNVCAVCRQKEQERIAQELEDEFPEDDDDYEYAGMTQAEIDAQIEAEEEMDRISAEQEAEENNRVKGEEE